MEEVSSATAPPPALVTPDSSKPTKSVKMPKPLRMLSRTLSGKQQRNAAADQQVNDRNHVAAISPQPSASFEEGLLATHTKSYDLTNIIDIIEPAVAPESQKDLFSASPPVSQKSLRDSARK